MSRHWNGQTVSFRFLQRRKSNLSSSLFATYDAWIDSFQSIGSCLCLWFVVTRILKREQCLPNGIGIGYATVIHERDMFHTPTLDDDGDDDDEKKMNRISIAIDPTIRHRATLQPNVPAPSNRQRIVSNDSRSISGAKRHFISFRLSPTAVSARWIGFIDVLKFTCREPRR